MINPCRTLVLDTPSRAGLGTDAPRLRALGGKVGRFGRKVSGDVALTNRPECGPDLAGARGWFGGPAVPTGHPGARGSACANAAAVWIARTWCGGTRPNGPRYRLLAVSRSSLTDPAAMARTCCVMVVSGQLHQAISSSSAISCSPNRKRTTVAGFPPTMA